MKENVMVRIYLICILYQNMFIFFIVQNLFETIDNATQRSVTKH